MNSHWCPLTDCTAELVPRVPAQSSTKGSRQVPHSRSWTSDRNVTHHHTAFLVSSLRRWEKSCEGGVGGKSHKGGTGKNKFGKATSPQLWTLPTQLLPPQRQGRAAKRWGGLQPPSTLKEIQTWGCLNFHAGAQNQGSSEIFPG